MKNDSTKHIKNLRIKGLPADFREELKKARVKRGWGQRELGIRAGLPQPHISAIESGGVSPRFDTLIDIVRILDMDIVLVPRRLVPSVLAFIGAGREHGSAEKPLYAINEDDEDDTEDYDGLNLKTGDSDEF